MNKFMVKLSLCGQYFDIYLFVLVDLENEEITNKWANSGSKRYNKKVCYISRKKFSSFFCLNYTFFFIKVNSAQPQICLNLNNRPYCYKTIDLLFFSQHLSLNMLIAFMLIKKRCIVKN